MDQSSHAFDEYSNPQNRKKKKVDHAKLKGLLSLKGRTVDSAKLKGLLSSTARVDKERTDGNDGDGDDDQGTLLQLIDSLRKTTDLMSGEDNLRTQHDDPAGASPEPTGAPSGNDPTGTSPRHGKSLPAHGNSSLSSPYITEQDIDATNRILSRFCKSSKNNAYERSQRKEYQPPLLDHCGKVRKPPCIRKKIRENNKVNNDADQGGDAESTSQDAPSDEKFAQAKEMGTGNNFRRSDDTIVRQTTVEQREPPPPGVVDVEAPVDLPGGYNFQAEIDGHRYFATVPEDGVRKGEVISVHACDRHWNSTLFDCCHNGFRKPLLLWNSLFCPLVSISHLLAYVNFNFPGSPQTSRGAKMRLMWAIMVFWVIINMVLLAGCYWKLVEGYNISYADMAAVVFVNCAYVCFVTYVTAATRTSLREKFSIHEEPFCKLEQTCVENGSCCTSHACCDDMKGCCYSTFFLPCAVYQMADHMDHYSPG